MNVENIPTYLKEHASWCNFRYEERKGNMTKVPYNLAIGYKAYVNKPETFTDFDTAVLALKDCLFWLQTSITAYAHGQQPALE